MSITLWNFHCLFQTTYGPLAYVYIKICTYSIIADHTSWHVHWLSLYWSTSFSRVQSMSFHLCAPRDCISSACRMVMLKNKQRICEITSYFLILFKFYLLTLVRGSITQQSRLCWAQFKLWLHHSWDVQPWVDNIASLCFIFIVCQMRMTMTPTS